MGYFRFEISLVSVNVTDLQSYAPQLILAFSQHKQVKQPILNRKKYHQL
jgi:hypothetical protein